MTGKTVEKDADMAIMDSVLTLFQAKKGRRCSTGGVWIFLVVVSILQMGNSCNLLVFSPHNMQLQDALTGLRKHKQF